MKSLEQIVDDKFKTACFACMHSKHFSNQLSDEKRQTVIGQNNTPFDWIYKTRTLIGQSRKKFEYIK